MRPTRIIVAATAAALALSGCGSGGGGEKKDDEPKGIAAGACLPGEDGKVGDGDANATDANVVDCAKPHTYEVTAVVDVPADILGDDEPNEDLRLKLDAAFSTPKDDQDREFYRWSNQTCRSEQAAYMGLDQLPLGDATAAKGDIMPISNRFGTWLILLKDDWAKKPTLACMVRWTVKPGADFDGQVGKAQNFSVTGASIKDWASADFPLEYRDCYTYDADNKGKLIDCSEAHYMQFALQFDALDAVDRSIIDAETGTDKAGQVFSDATYTELDQVCDGLIDALVGADRTEIKGSSDRGGGWVDESANDAYFGVQCSIQANDGEKFDLPGENMIGIDDAAIELVPFG